MECSDNQTQWTSRRSIRRLSATLLLMPSIACVGAGEAVNASTSQAATAVPSQTATAPVTQTPVRLPAGAKALQAADVSAVVSVARREIPALTPGDYRVSGEQRFNGWFLTAERVVFEADAKLIFTQAAIKSRSNLFILTKEIVSLDQQRPGQIVWETPPPAGAPGQAGAAPTGANNNQSEGTPGGRGNDGATGAAGTRGYDGPNLTLITLAIRNPVMIGLVGTVGGPGGQGQHGGPGGAGGFGNSASQNAFNCNRGAGSGAPGGSGGNGGAGGPGGPGGSGGAFTLIVPDDQIGLSTRYLKVDLSAGDGGTAGVGGNPGAGGPGGSGGAQQLPYCQGDGPRGPAGAPGGSGGQGPSGSKGRAGDYFVGSITPAIFGEFTAKPTSTKN